LLQARAVYDWQMASCDVNTTLNDLSDFVLTTSALVTGASVIISE